jgi:glucose-6-phosphate 1-dehydrogenase
MDMSRTAMQPADALVIFGITADLIHDALVGDHSLFAPEDAVEETWRVLQPLIDHPPAVLPYAVGSWGPPAAEDLIRGNPPWQSPWLALSEA